MDETTLNRLRLDDRGQLETLLTALNGAKRAIRRDECGDWTIAGSRGTIRACDGKYYVYIPSGSALAWTWAKKKLASFTAVSQDGDDEGIMLLNHLPDVHEAETLRSYIGLRQTHTMTEEQAQALKEARDKGSAGSLAG